MKEMASAIAEAERKKHQASIGDVREILGIVSDMIVQDSTIIETLIRNGKRRAKTKSK